MMFEQETEKYFDYCIYQKKLSDKTLKAYRIDLKQFFQFLHEEQEDASRSGIARYITHLHKRYQPKSIKRKMASIKAFMGYLEYEEIIPESPFNRLRLKIREPALLPRTIPFETIEAILSAAYQSAGILTLTEYQHRASLRDIAVLETLFATGIRVSELCSLEKNSVNLREGSIRVYGKGAKERIIGIENQEVLQALRTYQEAFSCCIDRSGYFFVNKLEHRLSEQSVRIMIKRYVDIIHSDLHITPHMFRHSFATLLLEEDVDIRYIQKLLGHSSIVTTQIYTHVAAKKQRDILSAKHPRNKMTI